MASINNAYPETYKIELVKRYLNGEMQKKIVKEHNIAKLRNITLQSQLFIVGFVNIVL